MKINEIRQAFAPAPAKRRKLRTLTVTSLPLIVTVVLSGTWMVCFPMRDILAVICTLLRLTAAVRGFARLSLAVVANIVCGFVECCGDSLQEIHQEDNRVITRINYQAYAAMREEMRQMRRHEDLRGHRPSIIFARSSSSIES